MTVPKKPARGSRTVTITLDGATKEPQPVNVSSVPLTEVEVVTRALAGSPGLTIEQLAHDGTMARARTLISVKRGNTTKGLGSADKRIAEAYAWTIAENRKRERSPGLGPILKLTPSALAQRASTNNATATRWLRTHHPELLAEATAIPPARRRRT